MFGQKLKEKLCVPLTLHIADKYVYVYDNSGYCIVVYETWVSLSPHLGGVVIIWEVVEFL